jgi:NAD(P)-dependent dehydrogenase (short-subunit alcohol dehydrogenase family)
MNLPKRVAMVTGANRGLGFAIAKSLAEQGLHVVLTGRARELVDDATKALANLGLSVSGEPLDVTIPESVSHAVATIMDAHGRIDALINNAAIVVDNKQRAAQPDFDRVISTMDTNLVGAWRCAAAVLPHMIEARYGRIVNISTHLASLTTMGADGGVSYRVSKTGLNALTRILAAELAGSGVLINSCSPGAVKTRMARPGVLREPEDATDTPVWLATLPNDGPSGGFWFEREQLPW